MMLCSAGGVRLTIRLVVDVLLFTVGAVLVAYLLLNLSLYMLLRHYACISLGRLKRLKEIMEDEALRE